MFEMIMKWIVGPMLDLVSRWRISGQWHFSYFFPVATALGCGLWWLGNRLDSALLIIVAVVVVVVFGTASVITFIPREVGYWEDLRYNRTRREMETESSTTSKKEEE